MLQFTFFFHHISLIFILTHFFLFPKQQDNNTLPNKEINMQEDTI